MKVDRTYVHCAACGERMNANRLRCHCGAPRPRARACADCGGPITTRNKRGCCVECSRHGRFAQPVHDRFRKFELVATDAGCLEWPGAIDAYGYGSIRRGPHGAGSARAHRVAFEVANGPIPDGLVICHRCDNKRCCNPEHLFLGTQHDNVLDAIAKQRHARGERLPWAKLTASAVPVIRARCRSGESARVVARDFGVTESSIRDVVTGRTWRHIQEVA